MFLSVGAVSMAHGRSYDGRHDGDPVEEDYDGGESWLLESMLSSSKP